MGNFHPVVNMGLIPFAQPSDSNRQKDQEEVNSQDTFFQRGMIDATPQPSNKVSKKTWVPRGTVGPVITPGGAGRYLVARKPRCEGIDPLQGRGEPYNRCFFPGSVSFFPSSVNVTISASLSTTSRPVGKVAVREDRHVGRAKLNDDALRPHFRPSCGSENRSAHFLDRCS